MMDIQDSHSPLPLSSTSSSSSILTSDLHPLSIGTERWQVGEKTTQQILFVIQPTADSEKRRKDIIEYIHTLIEDSFGIKVFPFGSVPFKTYLPHGDVDLTAVSHYDPSQDLAADICNLLQDEEKNNTRIQVKDVLYVPAQVLSSRTKVFLQAHFLTPPGFVRGKHPHRTHLLFVEPSSEHPHRTVVVQTINISLFCAVECSVLKAVKVVKCSVGGIAVDISFNQTAGLCALCFLEQVDQFIGKDHLFKRSVILIKAWCYYESRLLGGFHGLISTYALETLVLHVINHFHSSLHCPLSVLYKFLEYYSTFDWETYCIGINGLVLISSLPEIEVQSPQDSDDVLLTDDFLRSSREAFSSYTGVVGVKRPAFPVKFLNILDPLRDDNNLGRSVSKGNFYRIRSALSYGTQKLSDIITLPPEKIRAGLEKFFVNTLERNGRGRRADVLVSVPQYGAEISSTDRDSDNLLTGIQYGLWFHDYGMIYPLHPDRPATSPVWINGWNVQYDQNMFYNVDESPPSSVDSPTSLQLTNGLAASAEEKGKSRGTGTYIPNFEHFQRRDMGWEENGKEEGEKEFERADSQAKARREATISDEGGDGESTYPNEGGSNCVFNFSVEEFPLLPGSKPIPIEVSQSGYSKYEQVNDTSASLDSLEFGSLKYSSPRSVSLSEEPGKHSDSDVSVVLDSSNDPVSGVEEDRESSKSEEKMVVPVQPLELTDEKEFPPLSRPAKPKIILNKKEFPPLRASLKPEKRSKWRKNFKEV